MDFTGERFIPAGEPGGELEIEHLLRYHGVAALAAGKVVLDAAAGEGYGSALLAREARRVHGLEIDRQAVAQARLKYAAPNLSFVQGSVGELPFAEASFDLVVSFETIEHVGPEVQEAFVAEIKRVLKPGGLLVMSTPDKRLYSDLPGYHNDFHVREFYRHEYRDFLGRHFSAVRFWEQTSVLAYVLTSAEATALRQLAIPGPELHGKYIVALCANGPLPAADVGIMALDRHDLHQAKIARIQALQVENAEKNWHIDHLWGDLRKYDKAMAELGFTAQAHAEQNQALHARLAELEGEAAGYRQQAVALAEEVRQARQAEETVRAELDHLRSTKGWRLLQAVYRIKNRLSGR